MPVSIVRRFVLVLALASVASAAAAADLIVSAAASLTNALREIAPLFEAQDRATKVLLNFGASDGLLAQIAKGAPADVIASADSDSMNRAEAQGLLVGGSRRDFAGNALVLAVPRQGALPLRALEDLRRADVKRIAIGAPGAVPAGRYARAALEAVGLWEALEPKVVRAQNVRQALDYIARGEVEAGFVYATDAAVLGDKVRVAFAVPTPGPIVYPIAAVAGSPNPAAARRFIAFVASPSAQAVLQRHGFAKP